MFRFPFIGLVAVLLVRYVVAQQIINGQIFTPGFAIVDSPQPDTPEGGGESLRFLWWLAVLTSFRFHTGCFRCHVGWTVAASSLSIGPGVRDIQYYHLPLELHDGQEFHDRQWHGAALGYIARKYHE